jgi:cytochrome c551/c552
MNSKKSRAIRRSLLPNTNKLCKAHARLRTRNSFVTNKIKESRTRFITKEFIPEDNLRRIKPSRGNFIFNRQQFDKEPQTYYCAKQTSSDNRKMTFFDVLIILIVLSLSSFFTSSCGDGSSSKATKSKKITGRALFLSKQCASCHTYDGLGGGTAPDLRYVSKKYEDLKGGKEKAREWFRNHIRNPKEFPGVEKKYYPLNNMAPFTLDKMSEEELELVIDFMDSLR